MSSRSCLSFHRTTPPAAMELTPNWKPLEARLPGPACAEFMWMYRLNGVEYYKHRETRLYLLLTAEGQCLFREGNEVKEAGFEQEWRRVSGRSGGGEDNGGK